MSVISSLVVQIAADDRRFQQGFGRVVSTVRSAERNFAGITDTAQALGNTVRRIPTIDLIQNAQTGIFERVAEEASTYADRMQRLDAVLPSVNGKMQQNALVAQANGTALSRLSMIGNATTQSLQAVGQSGGFLQSIGTALTAAQAKLAPFTQGMGLLSRAMNQLNLVNTGLLGDMDQWNLLDVARGPGRLQVAMDKLKFALAGIIPRQRELATVARNASRSLIEQGVAMRQNAKTNEGRELGKYLETQGRKNLDLGQSFQLRPLDAIASETAKKLSSLVGAGQATVKGMQAAGQGVNFLTKKFAELRARSEDIPPVSISQRMQALGGQAARTGAQWTMFAAKLGARGLYETANVGLVQINRAVGGLAKGLVSLPGVVARGIGQFTGLSQAATKLGGAFGRLPAQAQQAEKAIGSVGRTAERSGGVLSGALFKINSSSGAMGVAASLGPRAAAGFGLVAGAFDSIRRAANFEQTIISFETMLGSAEQAKTVVGDLTKFADVTPFATDEVIDAGKQLKAYGFAANDLIPSLTKLGDVSSGLNVPLGDMVYLYGTLRAQGKAYTKDLNQFTARGVPILATLAEQFGVTESEVFKLAEQGKISFGDIEQSFSKLTAKGGPFFELMAKQSKTLGGLFSTLQGNIGTALTEIGTALVEGTNLKGFVNGLISGVAFVQQTFVPALVSGFQQVGAIMGPIFAGVGRIAWSLGEAAAQGLAFLNTFLAPVMPYLKTFGASLVAVLATMGIMQTVIPLVGTALAFLGGTIAAIVSPVGIVVVALAGLATWIAHSSGMFENFGATIESAMLYAEYAFKNFGQTWEMIVSSLAYNLVRIGADAKHFFVETLPQYVMYLGREWQNVFKTVWSFMKNFFSNLLYNAGRIFKELLDFVTSLGTNPIEFNFSGMLDGFENSMGALPKIADRQIGETERVLKEGADRAAKNFGDGFAKFAEQRAAEKALEAAKRQKEMDDRNANARPPVLPAPMVPPELPQAPDVGVKPPEPPTDTKAPTPTPARKDIAAYQGNAAVRVGSEAFAQSMQESLRAARGFGDQVVETVEKVRKRRPPEAPPRDPSKGVNRDWGDERAGKRKSGLVMIAGQLVPTESARQLRRFKKPETSPATPSTPALDNQWLEFSKRWQKDLQKPLFGTSELRPAQPVIVQVPFPEGNVEAFKSPRDQVSPSIGKSGVDIAKDAQLAELKRQTQLLTEIKLQLERGNRAEGVSL